MRARCLSRAPRLSEEAPIRDCSPAASRSSAFQRKVAQPVERTDEVLDLGAGEGRFPWGVAFGHCVTVDRCEHPGPVRGGARGRPVGAQQDHSAVLRVRGGRGCALTRPVS